MGHAGADARRFGGADNGAAAIPAEPGGELGGAAADALPQRRAVEPVRRGAVRQRASQIGPSAWEHVEVDFATSLSATDVDVVSSLTLAPGGSFNAIIGSRSHVGDGRSATSLSVSVLAIGSWRPCRGGVELVFDAENDLELDELTVQYRLCRGCLVADTANLPDGLAQEYSRCDANNTSKSPMLERMLADAPQSSASSTAVGAADNVPGIAAGVEIESADDIGRALPAGIIEEGAAPSDDEDGRCFPVGLIEDGAAPSEGSDLPEGSDEYPDDFEDAGNDDECGDGSSGIDT